MDILICNSNLWKTIFDLKHSFYYYRLIHISLFVTFIRVQALSNVLHASLTYFITVKIDLAWLSLRIILRSFIKIVYPLNPLRVKSPVHIF